MSNIQTKHLTFTAAVVAYALLVFWKRTSKKKQDNKPCVIILGDIFLDINASTSKLPTWGCDLISKKAIEATAGGSALNTATHLSSAFNVKTSVWSSIGKDLWGKIIVDHASKHGIILKGNLDSCTTAVCMVLSGNKDRGFLTYRGPMDTLSIGQGSGQLDKNDIIKSISSNDHFHIAGYYNCPTLWDEPSASMLRLAREKGATTSINCQYDTTGEWGHLRDVLPHADFVFLNRDEALLISSGDTSQNTQKDIEKSANWFLDQGVRVVVITQGGEGALAMISGKTTGTVGERQRTLVQVGCSISIPIPLVDTTGAGDAFISGFLHGFQEYCTEKKSQQQQQQIPYQVVSHITDIDAISKCLRWGVAAGCTCVGQFGAGSPFPYEQVNKLLPTESQVHCG